MKKSVVLIIFILSTSSLCHSQEWMKSLVIAKRLALTENKMILMMWEDSTLYPFPVTMFDEKGRKIKIEDLFDVPEIEEIIWDNFVPVTINETMYSDLFDKIKGKRKLTYIDKFNDDSIKIMDVNGNILNTANIYAENINLTELIRSYALNTSYLKQELINYRDRKDFYTTFYLASKYVDYAIYVQKAVKKEIIDLSDIYFKEAEVLLTESDLKGKIVLEQRFKLQGMKQDLILNNPKKILRQLKRIDAPEIEGANASLVAFIYFTAHLLLKDETSAAEWRPKVSAVNFKKAGLIINANK
jgi:hypothetical protein